MKKNSKLQMVILIVIAVAVGFVAGLMVDYPATGNDMLAGSIGKVEKSRNVKVTEDDIQLRNDLVEDAAKKDAYQKLLGYYYTQAASTYGNVEKAIGLSHVSEGFTSAYPAQAAAINNYKTYLETARIDILNALNAITTLDDKKEIPVMGYLNQANNAISRIRSQENMLVNYADAIQTYINNNPDAVHIELEEAHDILCMNVLRSALVTQNKPMLAYLKDHELFNSKEELNLILSAEELNSIVAFDAEKLGMWVSDNEQLNFFGYLADMDKLNSIVLSNADQLGLLVLLNDQTSLMNDVQQLNGITRLMDTESLGALMFII